MREAYQFGPFRLLVHQRELSAHGVPIPVGQRAFDILLVLVSRHGHLVTKDELMAEVWPGVIVEENNIQVHISALRKVLGTGGDPKRYLVTVPGRGYRFVAPVKTESADHSSPSTAALAEQTAAAAPGTVGSQQAGNNLPNQLTSLIGRETEVAEIKAELSNHRLVSLTGAGGVGKTRLAVEVSRSLLERYPDGVWFVELAPLIDAHLIVATIGAILGVNLGASSAPDTALTAALRTKQLLMILDNCEHVIEEAARIAEALVRVCAHITILATSRERLAIAGEVIIQVPSLPTPQASADLSARAACEYAAVRLFVERANALGIGLILNDANAPVIGSICHRLDGIPLAIELAVPRLRVFSVGELARGLEARFPLLTGGNRTALPRQQTLYALIDWSYALLNDSEKLLLTRLAVFSGSALQTSITAVVAGTVIAPEQIGDLLLSLAEKSLVYPGPVGNEPRYRLLESTRYFAAEKLGPAADIRRRHAEHFVARFAVATAEWESTPTQQWIVRYEPDLDNLRGSLEWAFGQDGDLSLGLNLVGYSHVLWAELGLVQEHRRWVDQALGNVCNVTPPEIMARLLSWQAGDVREIDDPTDYEEAMRAVKLYRKAGEGFQEGRVLLRAGTSRLSDKPGEAEALLRKAQALLRPFGPTKTLAKCLSALASARLFAADISKAQKLHNEAIQVLHALGETI
jgi:predicted ATPase/DNA-binding winged helix-turn-helix (wHTH) protein